jgi:RNA polymerase sigma-70 factor (ECF subfamily)
MGELATGRALDADQAPEEAGTSFRSFFEDQSGPLLHGLVVVTGSTYEAEDIAQEAFTRVYERWERVGSMDDPAGYLHRTAMNVFRSRYRRAKVALRRATWPAPEPDAFEAIARRDAAAAALGRLTPRQRAALVLTEGFGYSGEEAARLLGIKASTVWALTHQARVALAATEEDDDD